MRLNRYVCTLAATALFASNVARAADDWVDCRGEAPLNDDRDLCMDRAKKAAQRDCLEKKLGTFVVSASQTEDFQTVRDVVLSSVQGYITEMGTVSEDVINANTCVVKFKAKVAQGKIDEELKARHITLAAMKYPRIALLISEQQIGQTSPQSWWSAGGAGASGQMFTVNQRLTENQIVEQWKSRGPYSFVDLEAMGGKLKVAGPVNANPSAAEIREYTNLLDADVIILGTAVAQPLGTTDLGDGTFANTVEATISVRAFNDAGEILATATKSGNAHSSANLQAQSSAIKLAAQKLGKELESKLLVEWNKRAMTDGRVRLQVKGIEFDTLKALKNLLGSKFKAVRTVTQKSFKDGAADFDLRVDGGDAEALADDLSSSAEIKKLKVKVVGTTASTVQLEGPVK